jgi:hypothetical protein
MTSSGQIEETSFEDHHHPGGHGQLESVGCGYRRLWQRRALADSERPSSKDWLERVEPAKR